jgi:hypothetical protein
MLLLTVYNNTINLNSPLSIKESIFFSTSGEAHILTNYCEHFMSQEKIYKSGVLAHSCNPSTWKAEFDDQEFHARLGYIMSSRSVWVTEKKKGVSKNGKSYQKKLLWVASLVYPFQYYKL